MYQHTDDNGNTYTVEPSYALVIKLTDDTHSPTKFNCLDLDTAEEIMEGVYQGTAPRDNWAGLAIIDENFPEEIISELEW